MELATMSGEIEEAEGGAVKLVTVNSRMEEVED